MGTVSRVLSVFLRLGELACGATVLGTLGDSFSSCPMQVSLSQMPVSSTRQSSPLLTIIYALVFMPQFAYSFWCFPTELFLVNRLVGGILLVRDGELTPYFSSNKRPANLR